MNKLSTLVENEISKMLTMHALTMQRGPTDTEAKQITAIEQIAYESSLVQLMKRLILTGEVFKGDKYLKDIKEWTSELYIEGRAKVTRPGVSVAAKSGGQAWVDASKAIGSVVHKL